MAILKTANCKGKYRDEESKEDVIQYILNPFKMPHNFCGGLGVDPICPSESMELVSEQFGKEKGVQLRHFIIAFAPKELPSMSAANQIAQRIVRFLGQEYQTVYAVHENPDCPHIHIVMNSVSYIDGHRYYGTRREFFQMKNVIQNAMREHGIRVLKYVPANG